jgi:putative thioredoxin
VQSIPSIVAVVKGQPVPLFQGALPEPAVRQYLDELLKVAESVGLGAAAAPDGEDDVETAPEEPPGDPRYDAAYDAVQRGDWEAAEAAYREVLAQSPADSEAQAGLGQVALLRRTDGVDVAAALADADANPDSVPAQTLAADVELLTGRVEQAFARLVELVRRAGGDDRTAAREHLVGLFQLVGDADPQVAKARTALANALF